MYTYVFAYTYKYFFGVFMPLKIESLSDEVMWSRTSTMGGIYIVFNCTCLPHISLEHDVDVLLYVFFSKVMISITYLTLH